MPAKKNTKKDKKRLVLLDAHAIIHRAYHALPNFSTSKGEPTGGLYGVSAMLLKILDELKPDYVAACYDLPGPTFRHEAYEEYKAGRAKADDDLVAQIIRSQDIFKAFNIPIYSKEGFEADDILGTIVHKLKNKEDVEIIIASGDMDTLQLVDGKKVQVYTLRKGLSDTVMYDEKKVKERFGFKPGLLVDFKGLKGDPSDNIIGISGIGEKTATELIEKFGTVEDIYKKLKKDKDAFTKKGFKDRIINLLIEGEEEALFSKTLATIRTDVPISFTLPKETWTESLDLKKIKDLFYELEFKSLSERAMKLFGEDPETEKEMGSEENISDEEIKKTGIALWLLRSDITNPDKDDILSYAKTESFAKAKERILSDIKKEGLEYVYKNIELPLIPIIEKAQEYGILIDVKHLEKISKEYHKELSSLEKKIWKLAGEEFNINSPKQLAEILFDKMGISNKGLKKTAGGARSTRESELKKLADEHEIINVILDYRELQKLLSTYIDNIPEMVDENNRLHTTLIQTGTTTGRFSSINPNLQNIPSRDGKSETIRRAFIAPDGRRLLSFDYSQIEMRALAVLSGDETLIETFKKGGDVHASVAMRVFGVGEDGVTKEMRRKAKVINFGILYGMGINALKVNLKSDRKEAQEFYDNYFKKFPKIAAYFDKVKREAHKKGYTETFFGRRRYFEGLKSHIPYIRASAERQALNAPLQGTAADIIKIAMAKSDTELKTAGLEKDTHLLLQIHDELLYEVDEKHVQKAEEVITNAMENAASFPVPLLVSKKKGKNWGDMKSI